MSLSRRDLLSASALLLAGPGAMLRVAARETAPGGGAGPLVLCWNENPYGPSPAARSAISQAIAEGYRYPSDEEVAALTAALAAREDLSANHIVMGTGSGELLRALGLLYGRDGSEINAALSPRTRAIYICNPNNPTGTALPATHVREFVRSLPPTAIAIVDEAYMDFAAAGETASVAGLVSEGSRVVVLRTFSKIHGMAGLRCGYAIAPPDIAAQLAAACMTTPNIYAVRAARASLADVGFVADCRQRILASRARITAELTRLKLRYADPNGNFVFFDTGMPL